MIKNQTIAFIGAGNMSRAIIGGLVSNAGIAPSAIRATRRRADRLRQLEESFPGIVATSDNHAAASGASVVVLSVKPYQYEAAMSQLESGLAEDALLISILAGITTTQISRRLGSSTPVIRAMPNTPALVQEGATGLAAGSHATDDHLELAREIFSAVGKVEVVPEELMDAVTGLSGSGPAYIYMVIEALTDAGVKQGIPRPVAGRLSAQTVLGAARLAIDTGKHPAILKDEVTTPGGTAIAAVAELENQGLRTMLIDAVATATKRARELSREDVE